MRVEGAARRDSAAPSARQALVAPSRRRPTREKGRSVRKIVRVAVLVGTLVALTATAAPAFAAVTRPNSSPYTVPADGSGNLRYVTVTASGFQPDDNVFIEQCDGTSTSSVFWDPTINCDLGSSPASAVANGSGVVTFSATDVNHRFRPVAGDSPQGLFNCRAPGTAASGSLPSFTNCQVWVSTSNAAATSDQQFFTLTLPGTAKLSCVLNGSLSFNKPITNVPPKKPKATKVKGSAQLGTDAGTACNNTNAPASATKLPVTSGSVKIKGSMPIGTNCSAVSNPVLNGSALKIKWKGLKGGALSTAGKSTAVVTSSVLGDFPTSGWTVTASINGGSFAGSTLQMQLALNSTVEGAASACNGSSLAGVSFTGSLNPSYIKVL